MIGKSSKDQLSIEDLRQNILPFIEICPQTKVYTKLRISGIDVNTFHGMSIDIRTYEL